MRLQRRALLAFLLVAGGGLGAGAAPAAAAPCDPPIANQIACENTKPGNPASEWDVSGAGSAAIQGFATDISVDQGETVSFKVDTPSTDYRIDIYRMGYYGGTGARKIATVQPSARLPQNQPDCLTTASTGLIDCGNWARLGDAGRCPADAVSGIYLAKLVREDGTAGSSHIVFVVRDDDGGSDAAVPDLRHDLAGLQPVRRQLALRRQPGRARLQGQLQPAVHHARRRRPRTGCSTPSTRWSAGWSATATTSRYTTGVDTDRRGAELLEHETFLSVGHDEYWSGAQRANVEAARAAGVQPRVLQRQRDVLEDALGASIDGTARRPDARHLQGDARQRQDRPASRRSGRARGATRASARRPTAAGPRTR